MGPDSPLVAEATRWLAELCLVDDAEPGMPRWATYERHGPVHVADRVESRQLNLGLAHGIIGPLAYLSIALRAGVAVPEARVAVGRLVDWLESWRGRGAHGTNWPSYVSEEEERGRGLATHADRGAWCYGTPGITRALHLAASALGDESLRARAVEIWIEHLEGQLDSPGLGDVGLCHGWAGLLRIAQLMNEDGPERDDGRSERIVQRILECWQPSAPLGFVYNTLDPTRWADSPALLDGAAGTAAALWSYANPGAGRGFWEEALLLC